MKVNLTVARWPPGRALHARRSAGTLQPLQEHTSKKASTNEGTAVGVLYSADGAAPPPGKIFSIFANSHSLLHNGHALRVFSHRWMQSK
jgi:hypothetical protein